MAGSKSLVDSSRIPLLRDDINRLRGPAAAALHKATAECETALKDEYFPDPKCRMNPAITIIGIDEYHVRNALLADPICLLLAVRQHDELQPAELQRSYKGLAGFIKACHNNLLFLHTLYPPFGKKGNKKEALG